MALSGWLTYSWEALCMSYFFFQGLAVYYIWTFAKVNAQAQRMLKKQWDHRQFVREILIPKNELPTFSSLLRYMGILIYTTVCCWCFSSVGFCFLFLFTCLFWIVCGTSLNDLKSTKNVFVQEHIWGISIMAV